jgi:prolipoprotein diacylglyceryltransferase
VFPVIQIGPPALQTPGLILLLGLWLGLALSERFAARTQEHIPALNPNTIYNLAMTGLAAGVVGARLLYILRYPSAFAQSPLSAISLNPGLLDPAGGLAGALVAVLIYGSRKQLPFWQTLDIYTPALAVFGLALGLSHLASGAAFGTPADLPWAVELWGARRHPAQVYEMIAAAFILAVVWPRRESRLDAVPGLRFLTFLALSAGARLFLEAFRGDSYLLAGGLRAAQLAAWILLTASLAGIRKIQHRGT